MAEPKRKKSGEHKARPGETKQKSGSRRALDAPRATGGSSPLPIVAALVVALVAIAVAVLASRAPEEPKPEAPEPVVAKVAPPAPPPAPPPASPKPAEPKVEPPPEPEAPPAPVEPALPPPPEKTSNVPKGVPEGSLEAKVVRCVDGDTIIVRLGGKDEKIRMKGVDTPETVHPTKPVERFGKAASNFTKERLSHRTVWLEIEAAGGRDKYGRLLAFVWLEDGTCHNEALIREGYGHAYVKFPFDRLDRYRKLEREAREAKRGLWGPDER